MGMCDRADRFAPDRQFSNPFSKTTSHVLYHGATPASAVPQVGIAATTKP
jgi:hypothetical protein